MMGLASLSMRADADFIQLNHYDLMRQEIKPDRPVFPESRSRAALDVRPSHLHSRQNRRDHRLCADDAAVRIANGATGARIPGPAHTRKCLRTFRLPAWRHRTRYRRAPRGWSRFRRQSNCCARSKRRAKPRISDWNQALRYADPTTRFAAACEALAVLNRLSDDKLNKLAGLRTTLQTFTRSPDINMTPSDGQRIDRIRLGR